MGIDDTGAVHHLYTPTQTVYVVEPDAGLEHTADISEPGRDADWVAYVGQERGWDVCWYFTDATGGWF